MVDYRQIATAAGTFDALTTDNDGEREVLLLHGFPEAALQWSAQLDVLDDAGCHAVAPDQRGYSPSVRPDDVADYEMRHLVDDVLAIADQLGWHRFDLVGHDWGSAVAWTTAATHPDRVRTLTAVSIPHPDAFAHAMREDEEQQQRSAYMRDLRAQGAEKQLLADNADKLRRMYEREVPDSHIQEYVQRLSEPGAMTGALNWYRANHRLGASEIGTVSVPTLYVWSTDDVAVGSAAAFATERHVTGHYRFEMLEDVSHWIPEQDPSTLSRLLLEHLATHPAKTHQRANAASDDDSG